MPLDNLPLFKPDSTDNDNTLWYLKMFMWDISSMYSFFMAKLGFTFRGGIAIDSHYEKSLNKPENVFIFSKALIRAHGCEERVKDLNYPSVLLDDTFEKEVSILCNHDKESLNTFFNDVIVVDDKKNKILNIYYWIDKDCPSAREVCQEMKNVIELHLNNNQGRILDKYKWLSDQHNYQMENIFGFNDLIIKTNDCSR